jgi:hypothetical protein
VAIAHELATLAEVWAAEYDSRVGSDLVIHDGNNRLTALAH